MKNIPADLKNKFVVKRSRAGLGLFALVPLAKNRRIIEYTGEMITTEEADRRGGKYLFDVNKKLTIDGKGRDNLARYINHSCRPNAEARTSGTHVYIYARRRIEPGEEIVYNYGKEYFDEIIAPHGCRCPKCKPGRN